MQLGPMTRMPGGTDCPELPGKLVVRNGGRNTGDEDHGPHGGAGKGTEEGRRILRRGRVHGQLDGTGESGDVPVQRVLVSPEGEGAFPGIHQVQVIAMQLVQQLGDIARHAVLREVRRNAHHRHPARPEERVQVSDGDARVPLFRRRRRRELGQPVQCDEACRPWRWRKG